MSIVCDIDLTISLACMFTYTVIMFSHLRCGNGVQLLFHSLIRSKTRHETKHPQVFTECFSNLDKVRGLLPVISVANYFIC